MKDGRSKTDWRTILLLAGAVILPALWVALVRYLALGDGENSIDVFYHARIAQEGPGVFLAREFPALQLSVWRDTFADKEMLFHVLLWAVFGLQKLFGFAPSAPYHFAAFVFLLGASGAFVYAARKFQVRALLVFAAALAMPLLAQNGLERLAVLRPHLFSIALLALMFAFLTQENARKRLWLVFALSFVYAWSYSNPHFIVIPVLIRAFFQLPREHWKAFFLPLAALAGVALGLTAHPQFPNSFLIWKIQSFHALASPLTAGADPNLIPLEMRVPEFRQILMALPVLLLNLLNVMLLIRLWEYRTFRKTSAALCALTVFAFLFTAGFFVARRSLEYGAPFSVLAFAALLECALREQLPFPLFLRPKITVNLVLSVVFACAVWTSVRYVRQVKGHAFQPRPGLAAALKKRFAPGTSIANPDWSDFPILYHEAPFLRWQWGLDPAFSYAYDARKSELMTTMIPASRFYAETGLEYAVLLYPRRDRLRYMQACSWRIVEEIPGEGWILSASPEKP